MRPTALGYYLCIHPAFGDHEFWYVTSFDKRGMWKASTRCQSKADAIKERRKRRIHHVKIAKERDSRKRGPT